MFKIDCHAAREELIADLERFCDETHRTQALTATYRHRRPTHRSLLERCRARWRDRRLRSELASVELAFECCRLEPARLSPALRWLIAHWRSRGADA